jgi:acyl-CoA thioesterase
MTNGSPDSRFIHRVGVQIATVGGGTAVLTLRIEPHHLNGNGVVHGGALFTLVDTAMGAALHGAMAPHERCATVDARISYLKAVRAGEVVCRARLLHREHRIAHLEATLTMNGETIATATGVFSVTGQAADTGDPASVSPPPPR